jgi:hypothetical protein
MALFYTFRGNLEFAMSKFMSVIVDTVAEEPGSVGAVCDNILQMVTDETTPAAKREEVKQTVLQQIFYLSQKCVFDLMAPVAEGIKN